ncbi:DUF1206 domain-containing protein [Metabacillus indicus]|uniref:Membrane protein n=1 Tax=Metabacillus indicus TaxID=246786 RepID=A0A084H1Z1_METID|nr:DUF1206 domain-containing protein [Metabacillus indicus]KEZ53603.1 membrane protein [Metabacillus indicus]
MEYSAKAEAKAKANDAGEETKPWIRRFGRFGYMAKGLVYFLIGVLALLAALGLGGKMTGTSGMFETVAGKPFGEILLWVIGIGLIGYVLWELIKAILDPERKGKKTKGILVRTGYAVSAVVYGAIAYKAISIAMHASSGGGGSEKTISAKLLQQPFGQWIIGLVGAIIIGYGLYELYNGYTERFMNKFRVSEMNEHERKVARKSGKSGLIARGIVLAMIGYFFIQTAITANPEQSKGIDGALAELASKPYGGWMLGLAAAGLMLYGIYEMIRGRYEHMSFGGK